MRLEGSLTRSRVKFCDSPMMRASSRAALELGLIAGGDDGERVDLLILAVAFVVVGIEVADEGAFDDGLDGACVGGQSLSGIPCGVMKAKLRRPRDFSVRTAAPARLRRSKAEKLLGFAAADQKQALGFELRRDGAAA